MSKLIAREIHTIERACQSLVQKIYIRIPREQCGSALWNELKAIAAANHGDKPLCLVIPGASGGLAYLETSDDYALVSTAALLKSLRQRFGKDEVRLKAKELGDMARKKTWGGRSGQ